MSLLAEIIIILGISCGILSAGLMWIRRLILLHYDYPSIGPMSLMLWIDARPLSEIAKKENSRKVRAFFKWLNILIPTLPIIAFFLIILSVLISPYL